MTERKYKTIQWTVIGTVIALLALAGGVGVKYGTMNTRMVQVESYRIDHEVKALAIDSAVHENRAEIRGLSEGIKSLIREQASQSQDIKDVLAEVREIRR